MVVLHCLHCIPEGARQLPRCGPPSPAPAASSSRLPFASTCSRPSRVLPRRAGSHRAAIHAQPSPRGTTFGVQDEQAWHSPIMFSFFSPASPVVVTALTSPPKFFISHFTFHVAASHCLSPLRRLGSALGSGGGKGAIYSIWPF